MMDRVKEIGQTAIALTDHGVMYGCIDFYKAAKAAGIYTIAVNTGPLPDAVLTDEGADRLYPSMQALCDGWEEFVASL